MAKRRKDLKFNIFGTKWTIRYQDVIEIEDNDFTFGHTDSADKIITVATKNRDGKDIPEREIELTTLHELVHAIFLEGQYFNSSADEPLVEWTAKCLLSLKEQYK